MWESLLTCITDDTATPWWSQGVCPGLYAAQDHTAAWDMTFPLDWAQQEVSKAAGRERRDPKDVSGDEVSAYPGDYLGRRPGMFNRLRWNLPKFLRDRWGQKKEVTGLVFASESWELPDFSITANTLHPSVHIPVCIFWVFQGHCTLWCFANGSQKPDHHPFCLTNVSTWVSGTQLLLSPWCKSSVGIVIFVAKFVFLHSPLMSYKGTVQA